MDRTVVEDEHDRLRLPAGTWAVEFVEPCQKGDKVAASLGPAGVDDELAGSDVERPEHGDLAGLTGCFDAQVGAALGPGMGEIRMGECFGLVRE